MAPDNDRPGMELFKTLKRHFPDLQGHVLPDGVKDFGEMWKLNSFANESRAKLALPLQRNFHRRMNDEQKLIRTFVVERTD